MLSRGSAPPRGVITADLRGRRVVLGVTGGIASYKSVLLARLLTQRGAAVDVVMTRSACEFVGPITFEAVTGRRVHSDIFATGDALAHIRLARSAECIVVAPATADFIARAVHGRADDLLAAMLLAAECPVLLAPAMNDRMWAHEQTRRNAAHAREIGYTVLDPDSGPLAFGEGEGPGRLPEAETIAAQVERLLSGPSPLSGQRVVVTAGGTREPIDPVRFISNHSSGKMGVALAAAAFARGAHVTLIAGSMEVSPPSGVDVVRVVTAADLERELRIALPRTAVLIMAAAPADFRPAAVADRKIKKGARPTCIELTDTPDILSGTRADRPGGMIAVGFALETDDLVANARKKLEGKGLDLVVGNRAGVTGEGFGAETNRVTLVSAEGAEELALASKREIGEQILERVEALLKGR
ncbi:MAG: bifunctional phosphopantothenoylcysteine decarboxylase/phosphopantothenate--cysteine ligase CoaBC [Gemmatimonadaceae bacterium]